MKRLIWVGIGGALLTLAATSCLKVSRGGEPAAADDTAGVTSAPSAVKAPAPSTVSNVGTQVVPLPVAARPAEAPSPAPQVDQVDKAEIAVPPPSPAVLKAVSATQAKLDAITSVLEGTRVRFVDCGETSACTARLEAQSLAGLRDLLQAVSAQQGGIGFVAREQLDGFSGRAFVADVTMGGAETRPVPTDASALLAN